MYNKRKFNKVNDKKILHKVKKQWVTISLSLLMMIGGSALATHVSANADTNDNVNGSNVNLQLGSSNKIKSTIVNRANSLHNHLVNNVAKQDVGHKDSRPLVNNHIARRITNINELKANQNGEYNSRVYSRINTPFRTMKINHPVYLHSSVDLDNSHRTGVLPKGQFVRINRAFKEYGYYNNYLRYELRLADKRNAFITGNKDLVSYVVPRNNYRYYQKRIGNLLKRADYKNATKLTKQFNKLNRQHKHDINKYIDLYELAYNTQQDFRHPVIVNYRNKVAKINNHHRRTIHIHNGRILNNSEVTNNKVAPASNVNSASESSSLAPASFNIPSYVPAVTLNSVSAVPTPSYSSNTLSSSVMSSSASINNNQPSSLASSSVSSVSSANSMNSNTQNSSASSVNNSNSNQSSAINSLNGSISSSAHSISVSTSVKSSTNSVASSKARAMSYSASQSNSTKASLSASTSVSQSSAKSASVSASESTSASKASSAASVSMSASVSDSASASLSNSASVSVSESTSASLSTSTSLSNSASVSTSTSISTSASMSASASSSKRAASISSANAININLSEVAATTLDDINHEREQSGLSALKVDSKLQTVASMRAKQLTKSFSHFNNKGLVYNDLDAQQVAPELVDTIDENISEALLGSNHEEGKNNKGQSDPKLYHNQNGVDMANMMNDGMMNWDADQGNGHRDNILDDTNRIIGIGVAYNPKTNRYYLAEDFSYVSNVPSDKNDSGVTQFQQVKSDQGLISSNLYNGKNSKDNMFNAFNYEYQRTHNDPKGIKAYLNTIKYAESSLDQNNLSSSDIKKYDHNFYMDSFMDTNINGVTNNLKTIPLNNVHGDLPLGLYKGNNGMYFESINLYYYDVNTNKIIGKTHINNAAPCSFSQFQIPNNLNPYKWNDTFAFDWGNGSNTDAPNKFMISPHIYNYEVPVSAPNDSFNPAYYQPNIFNMKTSMYSPFISQQVQSSIANSDMNMVTVPDFKDGSFLKDLLKSYGNNVSNLDGSVPEVFQSNNAKELQKQLGLPLSEIAQFSNESDAMKSVGEFIPTFIDTAISNNYCGTEIKMAPSVIMPGFSELTGITTPNFVEIGLNSNSVYKYLVPRGSIISYYRFIMSMASGVVKGLLDMAGGLGNILPQPNVRVISNVEDVINKIKNTSVYVALDTIMTPLNAALAPLSNDDSKIASDLNYLSIVLNPKKIIIGEVENSNPFHNALKKAQDLENVLSTLGANQLNYNYYIYK